MSNSTNIECSGSRSRLLATVSALALVLSIGGYDPVMAADSKPALWVELGWDIENIRNSQSNIDLPLGTMVPRSGLTDPLSENLKLARSYSDEGKITFQPHGSDWVFSASVRYGRARGRSQINQELTPIPTTSFESYHLSYPFFPSSNRTQIRHAPVSKNKLGEESSQAESHFIIDFDAGKDVGLGLFGHGSTSNLSAGVRFAHFTLTRKASNFQETQGIHFQTSSSMTSYWPGYRTARRELWSTISGNGSTAQRFNGIGPSIRWDSSIPIWGDARGGGVMLDWGANAAVLFGKHKKKTSHQSASADHCAGVGCPLHEPVYTSSGDARGSKTVTVPNIGGFAGLSLRYQDLKVSFGYRADLFINAVDVGFDTRKSSNMLFHGPYASIGIGLGN